MKQMCASGKKYDITLNTFGESYRLQSHSVRGLQISNLDITEIINLTTVYTKDRMSVSIYHIRTSEQDDHTYRTFSCQTFLAAMLQTLLLHMT